MSRIAAPLVLIALLAVACGSSGKDLAEPDPSDAAAAETTTTEADIYPPNDDAGLAAIFDPLLEPLGVRFTYGSLNDTSQGGYERSDTGNHLALYVEPTGEYSDEDYIEGLYTITALATPFVFETWEGVTSYDICQEPRPEDDDSDPPPPATQVNIEREVGEAYDWANGDLESMLQYAFDVGGSEFSIVVAPPLDSVPEFRDLAEQIFTN